jgi:hypothetical protein
LGREIQPLRHDRLGRLRPDPNASDRFDFLPVDGDFDAHPFI